MKTKEYFYCKSYQAFFMALILKQKGKEVVIITSTSDIIKTCKLLNIRYISFEYISFDQIVKNLFNTKRLINRLCNIIYPGKLHFSHKQIDVLCFLLVHEYSNKYGKVFFYNFEFVYEEYYSIYRSKYFFYLLIIKKIINIFFKINIIIVKTGSNNFMYGINNKFLLINGIKTIDCKNIYYDEIYEVFKKNQICIKTVKNLFISQNLIYSNLVYRNSIKDIYNYLDFRDIAIKYHPYFKVNDVFKKKIKIQSFLPVELIYKNITNSIISIHSSALITASKFKHLRSISLLELIEFTNNEFKKSIKHDLLNKSENRILFPKTFNELDKLL